MEDNMNTTYTNKQTNIIIYTIYTRTQIKHQSTKYIYNDKGFITLNSDLVSILREGIKNLMILQ